MFIGILHTLKKGFTKISKFLKHKGMHPYTANWVYFAHKLLCDQLQQGSVMTCPWVCNATSRIFNDMSGVSIVRNTDPECVNTEPGLNKKRGLILEETCIPPNHIRPFYFCGMGYF